MVKSFAKFDRSYSERQVRYSPLVGFNDVNHLLTTSRYQIPRHRAMRRTFILLMSTPTVRHRTHEES